jgi:hypothetical protein
LALPFVRLFFFREFFAAFLAAINAAEERASSADFIVRLALFCSFSSANSGASKDDVDADVVVVVLLLLLLSPKESENHSPKLLCDFEF